MFDWFFFVFLKVFEVLCNFFFYLGQNNFRGLKFIKYLINYNKLGIGNLYDGIIFKIFGYFQFQGDDIDIGVMF